jgi:hypothetical protein
MSSYRWQGVFDSHGYQCVYCGVSLGEDFRVFHSSTEDHLYPRFPKNNPNQGADTTQNLVPACQVCNSLKDDYIPGIASSPGVLVKTRNGKWQVAPEHKERFIQEVTTEIKRREAERRRLFDSERIRRQTA